MTIRKIVQIDAERCDGCGLCVQACHEGAMALVDGKAKLVSESYCDGLGACLPECPQDAITVVEREAEAFGGTAIAPSAPVAPSAPAARAGGCPGARARMLPRVSPAPETRDQGASAMPSALGNWPVQLHLVPVQAPYYRGATLLIAADCVAFAYPAFHRKMLAGRTLIIGCPKLDDTEAYTDKLASILRLNEVRAVEVAFMEVPCCHALCRLVTRALGASGKEIPLELIEVGIQGEIIRPQTRETA